MLARDGDGGREPRMPLGRRWVATGGLLPESVSNWSTEAKDNLSSHQWWEDVQDPEWDKDEWWVNAGHAYFGAVYYIRARERGFGEVPSSLYAGLASGLYEFGVEAVFERPSLVLPRFTRS